MPSGGRTLVWAVGHLHPGGLYMDMQVARDGPDAGSTAGDDPSEVRPLFRSDAHYYEPAGAVSWDVAMTATRPDWRVHLKAGDVVSINATYDVRNASWYESMGLFPLEVSTVNDDPLAKDPFDDAAAVKAMYDEGGILTHGRLPENVDRKASKDLKLPDPRKLRSKGRRVPKGGLEINGFGYGAGGYSAFRGFPTSKLRPAGDQAGEQRHLHQHRRAAGRCRTPSRSGTASPPAGRRATGARGSATRSPRGRSSSTPASSATAAALSTEVTTGSNVYTTPPLTKPGKTYTYFCRIHPFMRGSIRVAGGKPKHR